MQQNMIQVQPVIQQLVIRMVLQSYYEHETGVNQIKAGAASAISASIESGDFDISATQGGLADLRGDGEHMMKIRRVLPDFLQQTGDARVTLNLKNYPTDSQSKFFIRSFYIYNNYR